MDMKYGSMMLVGAALTAALGGNALAAGQSVDSATTNPVQIRSGFANGPGAVPNAMRTIKSLRLPAGNWAVSAKLFVEGGVYADCRLSAGGNYDEAKTGLYGTAGTITGTLAMNVVVSQTAPARAKVSCTDQTGTMNWWYLKITAVKGGLLTNTQL